MVSVLCWVPVTLTGLIVKFEKKKILVNILAEQWHISFIIEKKIIRTDDRGPDKTEKMQKKVDE